MPVILWLMLITKDSVWIPPGRSHHLLSSTHISSQKTLLNLLKHHPESNHLPYFHLDHLVSGLVNTYLGFLLPIHLPPCNPFFK